MKPQCPPCAVVTMSRCGTRASRARSAGVDDGIVERGEHSGGGREGRQTISRDRVAGEVVVHGRVLGVAEHQLARHLAQVADAQQLLEIVVVRARPAASSPASGSTCARSSCDRWAVPRSSVVQRDGRIEHRRNRDDALQRQVRRFGMRRDAQHEVSAQRKPRERHRQPGEFRRQRAAPRPPPPATGRSGTSRGSDDASRRDRAG